MPRSRKKGKSQENIAERNFWDAYRMLEVHPMFAPVLAHARVYRYIPSSSGAGDGWAVVSSAGVIYTHPTRRAEPEEWVYVLAHCMLHLGFGHFRRDRKRQEWNTACDCFVARFLRELKLGRAPADVNSQPEFAAASEDRLYDALCESGIPPEIAGAGTAGPQPRDMFFEPDSFWNRDVDWKARFGVGLSAAVASAVSVAAGYDSSLGVASAAMTPARRAHNWIVNSYPLLGAMAANFQIVEDPQVCIRLDISTAAVDAESKEIFVNPAAGLDDGEARFVVAHELLHVGLRHDARRRGRDPFIWNVACDYVINGWLVEMGLGELPKVGALYDPDLKGESAETIYDRIVTDLRRCRKLCTLAGPGRPDILQRGKPDWWARGDGLTLDELYRRCIGQGLVYHQDECRGYLPAGLVEEIRTLSQPPIRWDVELAEWFDDHFSPIETRRSYARPSRRQSATPDIPRPRYVPAEGAQDGRTFGVVLDTSGSMDRATLGKALGAIASYAVSRDVPMARVVFCDAAAYDQGYMPPEGHRGACQGEGARRDRAAAGHRSAGKGRGLPQGRPHSHHHGRHV